MTDIQLVPGRSCEGCTMCCELLSMPQIKKPRLVLCEHCERDRGCRIYEERPPICIDFHCAYRLDAALGEEWRPPVSKMIINYEPQSRRLNVTVDPAYPDAWRRAPYYQQIKAMALAMLQRGEHLIVWQGRDGIGVLPHKEVLLGPPRENQVIVAGRRKTPAGVEYDIVAMDRDDPRIRRG